jgi:hypothetical protein
VEFALAEIQELHTKIENNLAELTTKFISRRKNYINLTIDQPKHVILFSNCLPQAKKRPLPVEQLCTKNIVWKTHFLGAMHCTKYYILHMYLKIHELNKTETIKNNVASLFNQRICSFNTRYTKTKTVKNIALLFNHTLDLSTHPNACSLHISMTQVSILRKTISWVQFNQRTCSFNTR